MIFLIVFDLFAKYHYHDISSTGSCSLLDNLKDKFQILSVLFDIVLLPVSIYKLTIYNSI